MTMSAENSRLNKKIVALVLVVSIVTGLVIYLNQEIGYDAYYNSMKRYYAQYDIDFDIESVDDGVVFTRWMLWSQIGTYELRRIFER